MADSQVTYKSEKVTTKMVYFEGTDTLYEGYCLCYNSDYGTAASVDTGRTYRVEKPSSSNYSNFAGVVDKEYAGRTGPCWVKIHVPTARGTKVPIYTYVNTTIDSTLLCLVADQYYAGGIGTGTKVIARAAETDATAGSTATQVYAVLQPDTNDQAARIKVGASGSPQTTDQAVKFWEMWTESSHASSDNRGLYWIHSMTGASASGEAGRFKTVTEGATTAAIHGIHSAIATAESGAITGQGAALRATVEVPDGAIGTGAIAPIQSEWYATTDGSTATGGSKSFFHCTMVGDATGITTLQDQLLLMDIDNVTVGAAGTGNVVDALAGDVAATHVAHIQVSGVDYYILLRNAVT